ncbi:MAG TPA: SusC/RagA family TonB-linked outer membrane protein [Flavobacterium sp.]|jgi:TonB-linked SusC/RagA family outer membrane protein
MKTNLRRFLTLIMALMMQMTFAQDATVSGVVSDRAGMPIPGVNVLIRGTQIGTQTDFDGRFTLAATPGQVLVFTFIGMQTREMPAAANMTVVMQDDAVQLEGVVVTSLGIRRDKKALGYATATVSDEELTHVVTSNPLESLSGKISGVDITSPATPGTSSKIIVRGFNTITGSNAPLIVVDGSPISNTQTGNVNITRSYDAGNGLNDIDPNSIESLTVLKGAAASALYGSRAGNGVIIITTKKGRNSSKINVDILSSVEFNEVARVPKLQTQFGQGWGGAGYSGNQASNENGSWGPAFTGEVRPWGTVFNNSQQIKPYVALEDNVRNFYDIGLMQTNSVSIRGGNDFSDFSLAFTNLNSDGVVPTDADLLRKRTLSFNGGLKGKKFTVRASVNYTNREQNVVNTGQGDDAGEGSTLQQDLLQIPVDVPLLDLQDYTGNPFNTPSYYFTPYAANPYFTLNENSTTFNGNNLFGNINMTYAITPQLSAAWQVGGNYQTISGKSYGAIVDFIPGSPQDVAQTIPTVGGVTESRIERGEFDTFFNLNYSKDLTEVWGLSATAGVNYNQRQTNSFAASITGLDVPNYYEITNSANPPTLAQNNTLRRTFGVYGQAELSYASKYFLTLSGRNDISSTLPVQNNSYFYPAASLSAVLIDTPTSYLKLRGAVAQIANDTDPYQTEASLIGGSAAANFGFILAPIGGVNFYELSGILGNDELKPERTTEYEVGIEGNLFSNRITFDASVYQSTTTDLIVTVPLDPSTGFVSQAVNLGDVENRGIELAMGLTPVKTENFNWTINYTFTKNLNELTRIEGGTDRVSILENLYGVTFAAEVGRPLGAFYASVPTTNDAGQYIVNPATGYYVESVEQEYVGDSQRDFVMGLVNNITYKNVSLSFGFDWKQGGEMYSYTKRLSHFVGNGIETTYNDRNPFIIPNSVVQNEDGTFSENTTPVSFENITNFYNTVNNPGIERTHIIDKTFVRLRDLSLYYNFSPKITDRLGLSKLSFGLYGKNLFLWTPDENPYVDPETTTFGNDLLSEFGEFGANPSQRAYGAVVKLSF